MHPFINDFGGIGGVCDRPLIEKISCNKTCNGSRNDFGAIGVI